MLDAAPAEQQQIIRSEVADAVQNATNEGAELVQDAVSHATSRWVNEVDLVGLQDRQQVEQTRAADLEHVRGQVQTVQSQQLQVVQRMNQDVQVAEAKAESLVTENTAVLARSQALNQVAQEVGDQLGRLESESQQSEISRNQAVEYEHAAMAAAEGLGTVALQADQISQQLNSSARPEAMSQELAGEVNRSLAQARHANEWASRFDNATGEEEARVRATDANAARTEAEVRQLYDTVVEQQNLIDNLEERLRRARMAQE